MREGIGQINWWETTPIELDAMGYSRKPTILAADKEKEKILRKYGTLLLG